MYNVTNAYKNRIRAPGREFKLNCTVDTSTQTLYLTEDDVLRFERTFNCGNNLELGGVYAVGYKLTLANKDYNTVDFNGATIDVSAGILVNGTPEYIAYNRGYVAARPKPTSTIELIAYDGLYKLNKPYVSELTYPATLFQIANDIATKSGLPLASTVFTNSGVIVQTKPDYTNITMSQVLGWIAQIAGSFVRLNSYGQIEFKWFNETSGEPITADHARIMTVDKSTTPITGIIYGDNIIGTEDNAFVISDNFVLDNIADKETALNAALARVAGTTYTPFTLNWVGDFAYQPGDGVVLVDRNGTEHISFMMIDTLTLSPGLKCVSLAKTKTQEQKQYVGDAGIKTAQLRQQIKKLDLKVDDNRTSLEKAIEDTTNLMARSLNTYTFTKEAGDGWISGTYISFNPQETTTTETEVWVQSASGFAHYPNGVSSAPDVGMNASGTLVAKLVAAGIVSADMVKTGILQNEDGTVVINLNTGEVRFTGKVDIKVGKTETLDALAKDIRKLVEPGPFSGFSLTSEFIDVIARDINIYGLVTFRALDKSLQNQVKAFEKDGKILDALTLIEEDVTVINGGLIATNTILADSIAANAIASRHLSVDAISAIGESISITGRQITLSSGVGLEDELGNSNLLPDSYINKTASGYQIVYEKTVYLDIGTYTLSLKYKTNASSIMIQHFNGNWMSLPTGDITYTDTFNIVTAGYYKLTVTDTSSLGGSYTEWAKLEKGSESTPWKPLEVGKINPGRIVLEGYTTINDKVKFNLDGTAEMVDGKFDGTVKARSFEVLNSDGVKIGGLYGTDLNAYLAAGRVINPAKINGTSLSVGAQDGTFNYDAILMYIGSNKYLSFAYQALGEAPTERVSIKSFPYDMFIGVQGMIPCYVMFDGADTGSSYFRIFASTTVFSGEIMFKDKMLYVDTNGFVKAI